MQHPNFPAQANLRTVGSVEYSIDLQNAGSVLGIFGLDSGTSANSDFPALLQLLGGQGLNTSQATGAIHARRVHNVYIHSQALSSNNVVPLGHGARTTLVKIPVLGQVGPVTYPMERRRLLLEGNPVAVTDDTHYAAPAPRG